MKTRTFYYLVDTNIGQKAATRSQHKHRACLYFLAAAEDTAPAPATKEEDDNDLEVFEATGAAPVVVVEVLVVVVVVIARAAIGAGEEDAAIGLISSSVSIWSGV